MVFRWMFWRLKSKLCFADSTLELLNLSCNQVVAKLWMFSKKDMWWLISGLNAVRLALLSAWLCPLLPLSHKPPPWGCRHQSPLRAFKTTGNHANCTQMCTLFVDFSRIKLVHIHHLCFRFSFCSSIAHSQRHTGIQAFKSASVGWCGRHYGSTASPSSDWISDQYPVPCWPASSSRTVCLWEPLPGVPYKKKRTVARFNSACWRAQMKYCLSFVNDRIMFYVCILACHAIQTYQIVHMVKINVIHT